MSDAMFAEQQVAERIATLEGQTGKLGVELAEAYAFHAKVRIQRLLDGGMDGEEALQLAHELVAGQHEGLSNQADRILWRYVNKELLGQVLEAILQITNPVALEAPYFLLYGPVFKISILCAPRAGLVEISMATRKQAELANILRPTN